MQKSSIAFILFLLFCFPAQSAQEASDSNLPLAIEESTIEFQVIDFTIEEESFNDEKFGFVKTIYFSLEFKAKRNGVWLPCEYGMSFFAYSKKVLCSQYYMHAPKDCSWSSKSGLPPLDEIETKLRPEENTKAGNLLVQKIKSKGYHTLAQKCLDIINYNKGKDGCLKFR